MGTSSAAAKSAADDVTSAGFTKPAPKVGSDVLTPPPTYSERRTTPNDAPTWMGGPEAPTHGFGPNSPTAAPFSRGANAPTSAGWASAAAPAMGAQIDFGPRYRVERLLGQGGMGAVYLAYDQDLGRQVALKLVRPELMVHPEAMARFRQELLLASKISHRNILRIHDLGDAGGMKFISMAFVDGEDLHHLLFREGKLPIERMLNITRQLCAALDAAHSEGVVHRDLKPQNIMLGKDDQVFVSDFGLAKSLGAVNSLTQSGEMLGTPRYMAPEQVEAKSVDARTDIYALGLIFYEMVTGDVPFTAETTLQLMYKRAHEIPPAPKTIVPDLPDWLNNVIMKCLERDPAHRYQSTREILADIDAQRKPELAPANAQTMYMPAGAARPVEKKSEIKKRILLSIVASLVTSGAITLMVPQTRHAIFGNKSGTTAAVRKSVAVLPLKIIGDEKSLDYIGAGVGEALIAKLSQVSGVSVTSSNAVDKLGKIDSEINAGKALGANYVFGGTLQGSNDKLLIVMSLDDVKTGNKVWGPKSFEGGTGDLLTLEDQIYNEAVNALQLKLSATEIAQTGGRPTESFTAYQLYLQGRNALRGKPDAKTVESAIDTFQKAVSEDPQFALAYTGIADASLQRYRDTKDSKWTEKASAAAEQAARLQDNLPEAHFSRGSVYSATGKTESAIVELQHAVELAPSSDEGYRRLGDAYRSAGRKQEALKAYSKAIEINEYYWYNYLVRGNANFFWGDNDDAAADYKRVTELAPTNSKGFSNLGAVFLQQGKWLDAVPYLKKATDLDPNLVNAWSNLGTAYFYLKKYDESAKYFQKAVELSPNDQLNVGNLAESYRWMGDQARTNATFDQAIALAQKQLQVNPKDKFTLGSLGLYYAKKGDDKTAQQYIRRARALDNKDVSLAFNEACINAIAGHNDEALKALRDALANGYPVGQIKEDPDIQRLASNAGYTQLLASYEAKK